MYYYVAEGRRYAYSELAECVGKAVEHAIIERSALFDKTTTVKVDVFETWGPTLQNSAHHYRVEVSPTMRITVTNY